MQAKAQLDALRRFIKGMEQEAVDSKRFAKERREYKDYFDGRLQLEEQKRAKEERNREA